MWGDVSRDISDRQGGCKVMSASKPTVFVVDDDSSFVTAITRLLRAGNYSYRTFTSATEFLKNPPTNERGCIIADLHMPGASGLELQDALEKSSNPLPIVFLTGQGDIPASVH